jgi:hypothetical protein
MFDLVVAIWIGIGWIPGTAEPVEVEFVVGDEVHRYLSNRTLKDTDGAGYGDGFEIGVG